MTTKPRYDFTACGTDYAGMNDESKEMLHQLVNAAGDRIERDTEIWERELREAGWKPYVGQRGKVIRNVYEAPSGELYRGPYGAWLQMKKGTHT